ncbi:MAG: hypothetical protein COB84_10300 [Rhodobacteraceae bacterium]|nr:MAG: hypothetical protein COB84_10300 [Paracoccaceae bacterium]
MIVQTIYECRCHHPFDADELKEFADAARAHNIANGVTSFLVCEGDRLLQVVEGGTDAVTLTMRRITLDKRLRDVKVRLMTRRRARVFSSWALGVVDKDDREFRRILKNLNHKSVFDLNILDALKLMKRVSGRKYRVMDILERREQNTRPRALKAKSGLSLNEEIIGLRC